MTFREAGVLGGVSAFTAVKDVCRNSLHVASAKAELK